MTTARLPPQVISIVTFGNSTGMGGFFPLGAHLHAAPRPHSTYRSF